MKLLTSAVLGTMTISATSMTFTLGTGSNTSTIIIESTAAGFEIPERTYEISYNDGDVSNSLDLLSLAAAADADLSVDVNTGSAFGAFINSLTVNSVSLPGFQPGVGFLQFDIQGGEIEEFDSSFQATGNRLSGPVTLSSSPVGVSFRYPGQGSVDSFGFVSTAVPEPSSALLAGLGLITLLRRKRTS